jgi:hypothetical protein
MPKEGYDMRRMISMCLCVVLATLPLYANSYPKGIKYLGGPGFPDNKQVKDSWDNSLNITDKEITFGFRKNLIPSEAFPVTAVKRITYGQATTRRVVDWVSVWSILAPIALVGLLHKSRQHRVLVEWTDSQQRERGMLMQVHKEHFVGLLYDLSFRTQKPIYADADDKEWLSRNGVKAELDDTLNVPAAKK